MTIYYENPNEDPRRDENDPRSGLLDMSDIYKFVDQALDYSRPERYVDDQFAWADAAVDHVKNMLDGEDYQKLVTRTAWGIVKQREGIAKRRASELLRNVGRTKGQLALGHDTGAWKDFLADKFRFPVQINDRDVVLLGALNNEDLVELELHQKNREDERREAADMEQAGIVALRELLSSHPVSRLDDMF